VAGRIKKIEKIHSPHQVWNPRPSDLQHSGFTTTISHGTGEEDAVRWRRMDATRKEGFKHETENKALKRKISLKMEKNRLKMMSPRRKEERWGGWDCGGVGGGLERQTDEEA
jgi:hypothetical protein